MKFDSRKGHGPFLHRNEHTFFFFFANEKYLKIVPHNVQWAFIFMCWWYVNQPKRYCKGQHSQTHKK